MYSKSFTFVFTVLGVLFGISMAYAQEQPAFDVKSLLHVLIPAIWASVGPMAISGITKLSNSLLGKYIPRPLQVVLSSVIGAIAAALADGGATAAATAVAGAASQVYTSMPPASMNAGPPPQQEKKP